MMSAAGNICCARGVWTAEQEFRMRVFSAIPGVAFVISLVFVLPVAATTINFDAQAQQRGGNLTGIPDSPITIGAATFFGGELRNAEVGLAADQTGVYASEGIFGSGETNPLVIQFSAPVDDFSVFVANGESTLNYTVSDNLGESMTAAITSFGGTTFSLPGGNLSEVYISSADTSAWNFAIDDVGFTPAPEPGLPGLMCGGLLFLIGLRLEKNTLKTGTVSGVPRKE
jgi:hypothetical protein